MAAASSSGASSLGGAGTGDGGGEAGDSGGELTHGGAVVGGGVADGDDCIGSSKPAGVKQVSPAKAAAARVWKEQPSQSHAWTTGWGGVDLDDEGVLIPSQECVQLTEDSEMLYLETQQSNNAHSDQQLIPVLEPEVEYLFTQQSSSKGKGKLAEEPLDVDTDSQEDSGDDEFDAHTISEDDGTDSQEDSYSEEEDLGQKLCDMKKRKKPTDGISDGVAEPEELFYNSDDGSSDDSGSEPVPEPVSKKKKIANEGPTSRSHCSQQSTTPADFVPSDDEGKQWDLNSDDDDGFETMSWALPRGRKSRAKKKKPRQWYDESRLQPEDGLCLKMCFVDVYQFRRAVQTLHIAQLRNFKYWRNCKDRVIVNCALGKKKCPFYMVGSVIKGEKTFCLRKMQLDHTCAPLGEKCKVTGEWVAKMCESSIRIDPRTGMEAVRETTKEKYGVEVHKMMAYRAKKKALEVVLGDQIEQYKRLRDYLQTVLDTNPGSRCIVTTKMVATEPSRNPRFHGLFYCLGASVQGFLNGCRPFIGLDGCFVKLTTGQQILAATGRDGNNNIFPLAFGLVDKEETASWAWFLTQLKYAIGGERGKFGLYTIISDRQKKSKQEKEGQV